MDDLISRQAAIDIVRRYDKSHMILKGKPMLGVASIVIELEELPSAERKGEWVTEDGDWYRCSVCNESCLQWGDESFALSNYCPNCGAKMVSK